ncbi:DEAD/DEAH box helicase [Clostridium sp. cel8]|uniref:DEAD/DEAH box helicase n=1 Tax=Clostridium sp. cel8 TaxID=2663123 RepID=UPI0015F70D04|nr:DEAD/DEAH box helicase [Clostridium sp. cel8]MBA5851153.1 DEAD/DEAH box helicase [Clostridium sp. cel8]
MSNLNFEDFNLDTNILKSINRLGYKAPSEVQQKVIPAILKNKDVIIKSQTGSGKTAAFSIPLCQKIAIEERSPQVLILSPTRELAMQTAEDFSNMGKFRRINCTPIFGREPITVQIRKLKQRVHVVVGTPGRILDHIKRGTLNLKKIRYLVIDEADELLNMGFIDQVNKIIDRTPSKRSTLLFSATIPKEILELCNKYMVNPINIEIESKDPISSKIKQTYYEIPAFEKFPLLKKIIYSEVPKSSIIFCRTKSNVDTLSVKMKDNGFPCAPLHGGMLQSERTATIKRFKNGEFVFLICTDVASRGLDIDDITHVINYDIPMERESYVHRIGRTGRAGKSGTAITFVTPKELRFLIDIASIFNLNIKEGSIPSDEEVKSGRNKFKKMLQSGLKVKKDKSKTINKDITKIYINAGKKKKIRPGDIAGTISNIDGVNPEDVGIIDIQDNFSYVDILSNKGPLVLDALKNKTIKGKKVKAEIAKK